MLHRSRFKTNWFSTTVVRVATLGAAFLLTAIGTEAQTPQTLRTDCIWIYQLRSIDPTHYDVAFSSSAPANTAPSLEFPTRGAVLAVDLADVSITNPLTATSPLFVSNAIRIENPTHEAILAAKLVAAGGRCFDPGASMPSRYGDFRSAPRSRTVQMRISADGDPRVSCAVAFKDVTTLRVSEANYPDAASRAGLYGTVTVLMDIDSNGKITGSQVHRSSGRADLDAEAQRAATNSTYAPKIEYCQKVPGKYMFVVDFSP